MFSFLPEPYKAKAKREYDLRLWASICLMLGCVSLVSAALVFPAYLSARSTNTSAATAYSVAVEAEASSVNKDADAAIMQAKSYMSAFQTLIPLDADEVVSSIVGAKPQGVSITSISIGDTDDGIQVSIGGVASTREELLAFSNALENVSDFSAVNLPVDYLANDTNTDYTISLSIKIQNQ